MGFVLFPPLQYLQLCFRLHRFQFLPRIQEQAPPSCSEDAVKPDVATNNTDSLYASSKLACFFLLGALEIILLKEDGSETIDEEEQGRNAPLFDLSRESTTNIIIMCVWGCELFARHQNSIFSVKRVTSELLVHPKTRLLSHQSKSEIYGESFRMKTMDRSLVLHLLVEDTPYC